MSRKNKSLPKPPITAFGRKKRFEDGEEQAPLMADRMAAAMVEGKLEDFLKEELPDNERARDLAMMMMGMTGMVPSGDPPSVQKKESIGPSSDAAESVSHSEMPGSAEIPGEVMSATRSGDVKGLMDLLQKEHEKRTGEAPSFGQKTSDPSTAPAQDLPAFEKEILDELIRIASENNVSLDWVILRALKLYVREFKRTGRL